MTTVSLQNALGVTNSLSVLCKQGTNPDNFAHKVELNFSLQSKLPWPSQRLACTKAHCSYHLKCERTAHSAFYMCVCINNVQSQEQHHHVLTMKMMTFLLLSCLSSYLWPVSRWCYFSFKFLLLGPQILTGCLHWRCPNGLISGLATKSPKKPTLSLTLYVIWNGISHWQQVHHCTKITTW